MAGPVLYSTNPWISLEIGRKYRGNKYFVWCSEHYDPTTAPAGSAAAAIAPSSSPKGIYDTLADDCRREDRHSALIKGYKRTFLRLAKDWVADGSIAAQDGEEIAGMVKSQSWRIWRPVLYVIPEDPIRTAGRLQTVKHRSRAAYGPELQILDLGTLEFDPIER